MNLLLKCRRQEKYGKKIISVILMMGLMASSLSACSLNSNVENADAEGDDAKSAESADLVVFGTIYTAEGENEGHGHYFDGTGLNSQLPGCGCNYEEILEVLKDQFETNGMFQTFHLVYLCGCGTVFMEYALFYYVTKNIVHA